MRYDQPDGSIVLLQARRHLGLDKNGSQEVIQSHFGVSSETMYRQLRVQECFE